MQRPPPGSKIRPSPLDQLEALYYAVHWREDAALLSFLFLMPTILFIILLLSRSPRRTTWPLGVTYVSMALIAAAKPLNKTAADNWRLIASQNYFDERGFFAAMFWSGPLMCVTCVGLLMVIMDMWMAMRKLAQVRAEDQKKKAEANDKPKAE